MNTCQHFRNPYKNQSPDKKEIHSEKLYKCSKCNKWFSFLNKEE